jgi:hypothetical protein
MNAKIERKIIGRLLLGLMAATQIVAVGLLVAASIMAPHGWLIPAGIGLIYGLGWAIDAS